MSPWCFTNDNLKNSFSLGTLNPKTHYWWRGRGISPLLSPLSLTSIKKPCSFTFSCCRYNEFDARHLMRIEIYPTCTLWPWPLHESFFLCLLDNGCPSAQIFGINLLHPLCHRVYCLHALTARRCTIDGPA